MKHTCLQVVVGLLLMLLLGAPSAAWAHIELLQPTPRTPPITLGNQTDGPCGSYNKASPKPTVLVQGEQLHVKWRELVPHHGYFSLRLRNTVDGQFSIPLAEMIASKEDNKITYEAAVSLPDQLCATCTLQLSQYLTSKSGQVQAIYYACGDIVVQAKPIGTDPNNTNPGSNNGDGAATPPSDEQEANKQAVDEQADAPYAEEKVVGGNQVKPVANCNTGLGGSGWLLLGLWLLVKPKRAVSRAS